MNQYNNQVQQSSQVSQEDLAKTQVLNLTDVQEIAKFERKTSKRPAVLFAIAGILAITLGFSYPNIMAMVDAMPSTVETGDPEEIFDDTVILNKVEINMTSCVFTSPNNPDGTSGQATYNLKFNDNDQLENYTMVLTFDPQEGNANGLVAVQNYYNQYRALDVIPLEGYEVATVYTETGMQTIVTVDLTTFNKATLTPTHTAAYFANVPFNLGDAKETITQQLTASNYVCE